MGIKYLDIHQFRNIDQAEITPESGFNFVIGKNGSGKTSLLEAIHCLGRGKSFRTHKISKLIQAGSDAFMLVGKVTQRCREYTIGMERSQQGSQIRLSGQAIKSTTELTECLPIALLEPGLHRLVEGGPEYRRKFLDWGVFHVEPGFGSTWKTFRRALEQRNAALRDRWPHKTIKQWDRELVQASLSLDEYRKSYLVSLKKTLQDMDYLYEALPELSFDYQTGWRSGMSYEDYLSAQYESDKERGFTQFGPHRADLRIRIADKNAQDVLSRGQQKLLVATLILAQCRLLEDGYSSAVILVDDLPAELDTEKRQALLRALAETGAQIFVTGTEKELFEGADFGEAGMFHVKQGRIEKLK